MGDADRLTERMRAIRGGRVLDVATGEGDFIDFLKDSLGDHTEIIGIDFTDKGFDEARQKFADYPVDFLTMDASAMTFDDTTFDTVAIANSLHHLRHIDLVLSEMKRVLKPGGTMIVVEMYRNNQSPTQLSHVLLHHWWASVNRLEDIIHYPTMTRDQILGHIRKLDLRRMETMDYADPEADPRDQKTLQYITRITREYLAKIENKPEYADLHREGVSLLERARKIGFTWATELVVFGFK